MKWVKCSEKLPDSGDLVVICIRYEGYVVTQFAADFQFTGQPAFVEFSFNKLKPYKINEVEEWIKLPRNCCEMD